MCNISHCVRSSGQAGMPVTVTRRAQWGKNSGINWWLVTRAEGRSEVPLDLEKSPSD